MKFKIKMEIAYSNGEKQLVTMAIANRAVSAEFIGLVVLAKSAKSFGFGN